MTIQRIFKFLSQLLDVKLTSPADGDVLTYVASQATWQNSQPSALSLVRNRGAWSSTTAYSITDIVQQGGMSYICTVANTNEPTTNAAYWSPLAPPTSSLQSVTSAGASTNNTVTLNGGLNLGDTGIAWVDGSTISTNGSGTIEMGLLSAALTGGATAPTAAPGTNTTQIATTAFVAAAANALQIILNSQVFS